MQVDEIQNVKESIAAQIRAHSSRTVRVLPRGKQLFNDQNAFPASTGESNLLSLFRTDFKTHLNAKSDSRTPKDFIHADD